MLETDEITTNIELLSRNLLIVLNKQKPNEIYNIETLCKILLKELKRSDVVYMTLTDLIGSKDKYYDTSVAGHQNRLFTFRELLKNYVPKTYLALKVLGALDDKYLNMIFVDFFTELLPENIVLIIMDSFLLEGVKILYRYGLALIKGISLNCSLLLVLK